MAKVFTFVTVIMAIFAMLAIFGIEESNTSQLLRAISFDNPADLKALDFFALLFSSTAGIIATLSAAGVIIVGLFTRQSTESILLSGFTAVLAGWVLGDMYAIIASANSSYSTIFPFFSSIIKFYMMTFAITFIIAMAEWWRGSD